MTGIEWTDVTWNPIRGCSRVSPGCDNCYAMKQARRQDRKGGAYEGLTRIGSRGVDWSGRVRMADPPGGPQLTLEAPLRWRKPRRVFVNSMSDLFHESLPNDHIAAVFGIVVAAQDHTFQVLTKRARRMREWFKWYEDHAEEGANARGALVAAETLTGRRLSHGALETALARPWPPRNLWLGVSAEDQQRADERIPELLATPAAVRFVSAEPLLGPIDLRPYLFRNPDPRHRTCPRCLYATNSPETSLYGGETPGTCPNDGAVLGPDIALDWVIVGGESGPGSRPCDVAWIRSIVQQCREAGVACFVKQLGPRPYEHARPDQVTETEARRWQVDGWTRVWTTDAGEQWYRYYRLCSKGGAPSEWPEDLRVREFPA